MLVSRMPDGGPEIFASIQGEGVSAGRPSIFLRLAECNLKCTWCFVPETPVLMADWRWKPIGEIHPGEEIVGIRSPSARGKHVKLAIGAVTRISRRHAPTVTVNGELRCTADHKFWLTGRSATGRAGAAHSGWREVSRSGGLRVLYTTAPVEQETSAYERGWLAGMADGDGCFWTLRFRRGYRRFRLALNDITLLARAEAYAAHAGFVLRPGGHSTTGFTEKPRLMSALWLTADSQARAFETWIATDVDDPSWYAGYLGGILDAEGSHSGGVLRIAQHEINASTRKRIQRALRGLGLEYTAEESGFYMHRRGGQVWRALAMARPGRSSILDGAFGHHPHASRVIESVEPTNRLEEVVTLSTTLGSFVAGGYVVKNCDTKYTWDWDRYERASEVLESDEDAVAERIETIAGTGTRNVVFTGGEPLLQQDAMVRVASALQQKGFRFEVETNGTIEPSEQLGQIVDQWNVSPKLANSGNKKTARLRTGPLTWFASNARSYFKFVVSTPSDLAEVDDLAKVFGIERDRIVLMPEGTTPDELAARAPWLVEECTKRGYRFSTRLHVLLWGSKRGT